MSKRVSTRMSFSMTPEQVHEVAKILGYQTRFFPPSHPAREAYHLLAARVSRNNEEREAACESQS